jgi:hypothetical protein
MDVVDLVRAFCADVPEPDMATRQRAYAYAIAARHGRTSRRPVRLVLLSLAAALLLAAAAAAAWQVTRTAGFGSRQVIAGFLDATRPSKGWIIEAKTSLRVGQIGQVMTVRCEMWSQRKSASFRSKTSIGTRAYEAVGQLEPRAAYIYDPLLNALYRSGRVGALAENALEGWAADPRSLLGAGKDGWQVERTIVAERDAYRISRGNSGIGSASFLVDAKSYAPISARRTIEIASCGVPLLGARRQATSVTYRYLSPFDKPQLIRTPKLPPSRIMRESQLPLALAAALGDRSASAAIAAAQAEPVHPRSVTPPGGANAEPEP